MDNREKRVDQNIGLVHTCAGRFRGRGIEYDDLFQAGCIGLIKAADQFDEQRGFQFSTYAVPLIIGEIRRLFRDGGAVKVSRSIRELGMKIIKAREDFIKENGREPGLSEIALLLEKEPEQISEAMAATAAPLSLTVSNEDGEMQTDIPLPPPENRITEQMSLHTELQRLENSDRQLIILRFYRHKTQTETAKLMGMTQVQVSRRERKILRLLRERLL